MLKTKSNPLLQWVSCHRLRLSDENPWSAFTELHTPMLPSKKKTFFNKISSVRWLHLSNEKQERQRQSLPELQRWENEASKDGINFSMKILSRSNCNYSNNWSKKATPANVVTTQLKLTQNPLHSSSLWCKKRAHCRSCDRLTKYKRAFPFSRRF